MRRRVPSIQPSSSGCFGKVLGAVSLAGVLDDDQVVAFGEFQDRIHVSHLSVQMNWNNRGDGTSAAAADQLAGRSRVHLLFEIIAEPFGIHVVGTLVNVDKLR